MFEIILMICCTVLKLYSLLAIYCLSDVRIHYDSTFGSHVLYFIVFCSILNYFCLCTIIELIIPHSQIVLQIQFESKEVLNNWQVFEIRLSMQTTQLLKKSSTHSLLLYFCSPILFAVLQMPTVFFSLAFSYCQI